MKALRFARRCQVLAAVELAAMVHNAAGQIAFLNYTSSSLDDRIGMTRGPTNHA